MSDFPERIWVTHKEQFSGHVGFRASDLDHSTVTAGYYPEYLRADLVPRWQPIETLNTEDRIFLLYRNGQIITGWPDKYNGSKIIRTGYGKVSLDLVSHWMPIPKVPG